jgi:uncharacterized protein (TIGR03067 family)
VSSYPISSRGWRCWLFIALLAASSGIAAPPEDAAKKEELQRHQGTWSVESSIFDGQPAEAELVKSIQMIVMGDHVVWKRDGKSFAGTKIVLEPGAKPKTIDVIPDGGRYMGEHVLGIYQFDSNALIICMAPVGKPRPVEFKADQGSGCTLRKFRRESGSVLTK